MMCPRHDYVFGSECYLCHIDSMKDPCKLCGKTRGEHAAVSVFCDEHYCPEPTSDD